MAMVRVVAKVEPRVCTTSRTKGHNHLKNDTVESADRENQFVSHDRQLSRIFDNMMLCKSLQKLNKMSRGRVGF
jgi:hypothetical protein